MCAAPCAPPLPSRLSLLPPPDCSPPWRSVTDTSVHKSHIIHVAALPDSHGTRLQHKDSVPTLYQLGMLSSPDGPGPPWSHQVAPTNDPKTVGRPLKSFPGHAQEHQALCRRPMLRGHIDFSQNSMTPIGGDPSQAFYT